MLQNDDIHFHTFYICKMKNMTDISAKDKGGMSKDKKLQQKWLFDKILSCSQRGGICFSAM